MLAIYIYVNSKGEFYDPTGRPPFLRVYVNFMKKQCHTWTYNTLRVQEEGSSVCGHHCIFYLIQLCAGHSMTDVTGLLDPSPLDATDIVKKLVLLLVNMLWQKNEIQKLKTNWKINKKRKTPEKRAGTPTSGCACAHPGNPLRVTSSLVKTGENRAGNPITWSSVISGSHGTCNTVLHVVLLL